MIRSLRRRRLRDVMRDDLAATQPETGAEVGLDPAAEPGLVARSPAAPTMSRRGLLGLVGGSSLTVLAVTIGQVLAGPARRTALLAPRDVDPGPGPNGFQINRTAAAAGITPQMTDQSWRLVLRSGGNEIRLSRADLLAMPQRTVNLPIACVEGWSSGDQAWTGVRLATLAERVGAQLPALLHVTSLQHSGEFNQVTLGANQVQADTAVLALQVNGVDLSADHGFPARVILPAAPGVHNTKWVSTMTFLS